MSLTYFKGCENLCTVCTLYVEIFWLIKKSRTCSIEMISIIDLFLQKLIDILLIYTHPDVTDNSMVSSKCALWVTTTLSLFPTVHEPILLTRTAFDGICFNWIANEYDCTIRCMYIWDIFGAKRGSSMFPFIY